MTRADEPGSGQSQWYGDQAQWYPETKTRWLSDQEPDREAGEQTAPEAEAEPSESSESSAPEGETAKPRPTAHPTRKDLPVMSVASEEPDDEQPEAEQPSGEQAHEEPEPEAEEEAEEAEPVEQEEEADDGDDVPVAYGQDGPPPPFKDRRPAKDGPPPPFEDRPAAKDGPPPPFEDRPVAQDGPPPPFEGESEFPEEPRPSQEERDDDEEMVLRKPIKLPPSAYELPRKPPEQAPVYEAPQQAPTYEAPPQGPTYEPHQPATPYQNQPQPYPAPPPSVHKPGLWHRLHFPVGVFLIAFGVTNAISAGLRWSDHRTEIAKSLGKAGSLADSAGGILVAAHVVEALLILCALVGLSRRRSVWFLPAIFGWMAGFGLFVGLDLWAGHVTKLAEHVVFLGGFTLLLFLSYALGIKARVNSTRTAAAVAQERPLTRTQEMALAALNTWQRRPGPH